jgi:hypothetical protein
VPHALNCPCQRRSLTSDISNIDSAKAINQLEAQMNEKLTANDDESGNLDEPRTEVDINGICKPTYLSKWHNEIIALTAIGTLIVTFVLALITYSSLKEVKEQRDLTYKQFVMANRPNVNIGFEGGGMRLNEKIGYIDWQVGNKGGDVEDIKFQCILFHMKSESKTKFSINEFYVRIIQQKYLNNDTRKSIHNEIDAADTLKKINDILNMDKRFNFLGLYIRAQYNIPPELTLDGNPRKDERYQISVWDVVEKRFEEVKTSYFEEIVKKISKKDFKSLEDQG